MGVAVLDSGVYPGSASWQSRQTGASRLLGWRDLVNGRAQPYDDNCHDTHVAGTALASGCTGAGV